MLFTTNEGVNILHYGATNENSISVQIMLHKFRWDVACLNTFRHGKNDKAEV